MESSRITSTNLATDVKTSRTSVAIYKLYVWIWRVSYGENICLGTKVSVTDGGLGTLYYYTGVTIGSTYKNPRGRLGLADAKTSELYEPAV